MRLALIAFSLLAGVLPAMAGSDNLAADRGQRFAEANCSHCHAVGRFGNSPLPLAPPFRKLHEIYPVDDLAEAFAEGIVTGHPSMPQFALAPDQIRDLIAYLKTLEH